MKTLVLAGALVVGLALTGCSGGDDHDDKTSGGGYCADLEKAIRDGGALPSGDLGSLSKSPAAVKKLTEEAPSVVQSQWKVVGGAVDRLLTSLEDAGVEPSQLDGLSKGDIPDGIDQSKMKDVGTAYAELLGSDVSTAVADIQKHATKECGIKAPVSQ